MKRRDIHPPSLARKMLLSFLRADFAEDVLGDLDEKFYLTIKCRSAFKARLNYWLQVLSYLRPFAIRKHQNQTYSFIMYGNYLQVGWRNMLRNKSYVAINTLGLGISLACCITVYLMIAFNVEFDSFYDKEKVSDIYRFYTVGREKDGRAATDMQAPIMIGSIATSEVAGIESQCRYIQGGGVVRYDDKAFNEGIAFADSTFFQFFEYPEIAGSTTSFKEKNSVLITEKIARKYFGEEDPVGKIMTMSFLNNTEVDVLVGGVIKGSPVNNSFFFDIIMRFEHFIEFNKLSMEDWSDWRNPATFVRASSPQAATAAGKHLAKYIPQRNKARPDFIVERFELRPFNEIVYQTDVRMTWVMMRVPYNSLMLFIGLAGLILLIACFNLTNTSIAMTARRLKEVGVRKAIGAARSQIITQFLLETLMIVILSCAVGFLLSQWIVPAFYEMWGLPLYLENFEGLNLAIALILLMFLVAVLAGVYPAIFSSKFKPTVLLKGDAKLKGSNLFTSTLVGFQFSLSVVVLVAGIIFIQNARYQETIKFGYDKDMLLMARTQGDRDFVAMQKALLENPKVLSVAASDGMLGEAPYQTPIQIDDDTVTYNVQAIGVGENFFETVGIPLKEGRFLSLGVETSDKLNVVVSEAFVKHSGLESPVGHQFTMHGTKHTIVGVVADHVDNLQRAKLPEMFVFYAAGRHQYVSLLVRTKKEDLGEVMQSLERKWKELFPGKPFDCRYQDEVLLKFTREINTNFEKMFLFITILGMILSVSGVYSLAAQNIARRTREIGIRKALGASVRDIFGLLNREFVVVLFLAAIGGGVGGYYLTSDVISSFFARHIDVSFIPVVGCSLFVFIVGTITTSLVILKAAKSNPVETLKHD
jgi:putative ABC transport system permease protein